MTVPITKLSFEPGDKVRLKEDAQIDRDLWFDTVDMTATRGSTGVVVSMEEYLADCERTRRKPDIDVTRSGSGYLSPYSYYPIRFEVVIPSPDPGVSITRKAGEVGLVQVHVLEKLDYLNETTLFILERVRVIFQAEDQPFKISPEHKLLLIDFSLENQHHYPIRYSAPTPGLWLTAANSSDAIPEDDRIWPLRIDLPDGLEVNQRRSGQVFFQVPERGSMYGFHLELPNIGSVDRVLNILELRPGDTVRLPEKVYAVERYGTFKYSVAWPEGLWITRGSYGRIASFAQFQQAYEQRLKQFCGQLTRNDRNDFIWGCNKVKLDMEECLKYPVLVTNTTPPSDYDAQHSYGYTFCNQGEIVLIDAMALEQLAAYQPEPVFFVTRIQVISPDDDHPIRPEAGHKFLLLDFAFEHPDITALSATPDFHLWLAYAAESASSAAVALQPVHVELAGQLSGWTTFRFPETSLSLSSAWKYLRWVNGKNRSRFRPGNPGIGFLKPMGGCLSKRNPAPSFRSKNTVRIITSA